MTKKKNSPFKFAVIITLFLFAVLTALVIVNNKTSETNTDTSFETQPSIEGQPTLGDTDAPVTVVEFGDFKCPACKAWGETVFPQLIEDYVDTGDVKFAYVNVLFHGDESKLGSVAAEAIYKQNPDSYWEFHKNLFKEQPETDHDSAWITMDKINEIAGSIPGIDLKMLQEDMQSQLVINNVNKDEILVNEFKVQQTPSIMVNGTMLTDPFDYEQIKILINKELEDSK
ncbi:DsbA family protein [Mesobacillus maritimus]|uniref:DsbA family protein n=1 Tax=Mesobacillus maritimus TaxID=1643336 RepID=UPI0020406E61|nr:thioredoxin domain-containing protein [Mesobacillus maritimus]MCM3668987.1 DsbA family protein [Mesobacillus maritimus]